MGRNKMEREFSEKLNRREIKPSEMAWDRLDAMLTVAEQEKPVRRFNWLYIAASFLGFLLIATLFFNRGEVETKNQVVQQEKSSVESQPHVEEAPFVTPSNAIASAESSPVTEKKHPQFKSATAFKENLVAENSTINSNHNHNQPANQNQNEKVNQSDLPQADELLAIVQTNSDVTPKKSVKVSAKGLLSQVDGEANMTFRQKVLQKVGKNYQNVKVALANRNVEDENH